MMKYEKSCYCILFRERDDEHIAKYLHVLVQESLLMLTSKRAGSRYLGNLEKPGKEDVDVTS